MNAIQEAWATLATAPETLTQEQIKLLSPPCASVSLAGTRPEWSSR